MEPESAASYNQARLPVEGLEHQPSHFNFDLQFVLSARCAGVHVAQELQEWQINNWSSLRSMPQRDPTPILPEGPETRES